MIARYSKDVATLLGIAGSTLRKYAVTLEAAGHVFQKDAQNRRMFFDEDIILLKRLAEFSADGMRLEDAAADLVKQQKDVAEAVASSTVLEVHAQTQPQTPQTDPLLLEKMEQMEQSIQLLADAVKRQNEVIKHQSELLQVMNAAADQQRLAIENVAAATQQVAAAAEKKEEYSSWIQRLFSASSAIRRPKQ